MSELAGEKTKLQDFMKTLQDDFDSEIVNNSDLMDEIGYDISASDEAKARIIAINKETINSVKALSNVLSLMTEIEGKIKGLDGEKNSVQQSIKAMKFSETQEEEYRRGLKEMEDKFISKLYKMANQKTIMKNKVPINFK